MAWTQELVDQLKAHRDAGLSRRQIAAAMRMTPGQISGMFDRLNANCGVWRPPIKPSERMRYGKGGAEIRTTKRASDGEKTRSMPRTLPPKKKAAVDPIVNDGPTILTVGIFHCKWPVGVDDEALWRFCGDVTHGVKPYCRVHMKLAYVPKQARKV